jgi:peptide/nickel transport system substrate-binding protein
MLTVAIRIRISACIIVVIALAGCTRVSTQSMIATRHENPWTHPGILRIGDTRIPDNLNRMLGTLTVDTEIGSLWCARLFVVDDKEALRPELATVVPTRANGGISADGRTITYHLRPGVSWQDGVPFTSDDVRFSWQQVVSPHNTVQSQDYYDQVSSMQTPDAHTAVARLKRPQAGFINVFFNDFCLVPEHALRGLASIDHAEYNRLPVGTGPFRVVENEPGVLIRLVANAHYWRGAPKLKEIDYHIIPDATTLLTQMRTHELDLYRDVPAEQAPQLSSVPGTTIYRYPFSTYADIGFNAGREPVSDVAVRRALVSAVDVPALIKQVTHDEYLAADSDQPPWRWTHSDHVHVYRYNPQKAAELFESAGWHAAEPSGVREKNGRPLHLSLVGLANDATAARAEEILQQEWRAVGVDVSIHNFPENVLYALGSGVEQAGNFDVAFEGWTEGLDPDNIQLYGCTMAPPNGWNVYHFCAPPLDRAETIARGSYDVRARKQAYAVIQSSITSDLPFYVLWFVRDEDLANSDLRGYRPATTLSAFSNPWEWSI